jgi:membrane protein DedA with SNARE-associated domain
VILIYLKLLNTRSYVLSHITELFNQYGYIVLYIALTIELIALPTPGETLMTYCGFLVFMGKLNWGISIAVAASGVITGITISYIIGLKLGYPIFARYGYLINMRPEKLEKASSWFKRYGNGILVVAFFIPGIRHITGSFSGITKIPYRKFALNSYLGALIWTTTFISLGRFLGSNWKKISGSFSKHLIIGIAVALVVLIGIYLLKIFRTRIIKLIIKYYKKSEKIIGRK